MREGGGGEREFGERESGGGGEREFIGPEPRRTPPGILKPGEDAVQREGSGRAAFNKWCYSGIVFGECCESSSVFGCRCDISFSRFSGGDSSL